MLLKTLLELVLQKHLITFVNKNKFLIKVIKNNLRDKK